jgi:hypothetical protein
MLIPLQLRLAFLVWAIFVVSAVEGRGHKSKNEEKAHNFESVGRVQQEKHGGFFTDAPGTLNHQVIATSYRTSRAGLFEHASNLQFNRSLYSGEVPHHVGVYVFSRSRDSMAWA